MKSEHVLFNVVAFLCIWIGVDMVMGQLNQATVNECIAALTMAGLLYFDDK